MTVFPVSQIYEKVSSENIKLESSTHSKFSSALPHTLSTFLTLPSMSQIRLRNQVTFLGGYYQTCSADAKEFTFILKVNNSSRWGIQSQYIFLVLFLPVSSIILTGALLKRFELPGMLSRLTNNIHTPLPWLPQKL